jgi:AcrR family transcriptional regulator
VMRFNPAMALDEVPDPEDSDGAPVPLPRGRHKLSRDTVRASQRDRLLRAMLDEVAEHGYEATTVSDVVARARVSRNAFYVLYEDKLACFLALCETMTEALLADTFQIDVAGDWRDGVHVGTQRYLEWWTTRLRFARAWLVELPTAGRPAIDQRDAAYAKFRERFEALAAWARHQQPELPPLHPVATRVIVSGITALVAEEVDAGRGEELMSLAPEIEWLVTTLVG